MIETKQLNIVILPGTVDDDKIVYTKYGNQSLDGNFGDLIVQLVNFEHNVFKRLPNDDLSMDIDITFKESLLGFERRIKFLNNKTLKINHSKVTQIGKVITVRGYGMNKRRSLMINVKFDNPKKLTEEQKHAIESSF